MRFLKLKQKKILPYAQIYLLFRDVFSLIHYLRLWADLQFLITLMHTTFQNPNNQVPFMYPVSFLAKERSLIKRLFMPTINEKQF